MTHYPTYEEEKEASLAQEAMTQGEYNSMALNQYAAAYGAERPDLAWISTPYDTWEPNPFYKGPPMRHPEADSDEDDIADAAHAADTEAMYGLD